LAGRLSLPPAFLALYRNAELGDGASYLRGELVIANHLLLRAA
jgi:hypothetical protein